ncbi:MAG: DUF917 domain-containing protein [Boseongicola sp. SB0673_bin_14]|nr:DUF917 domain-containing protein [Boseongicola sp. SB0673_bin_14]
MKAWDVSPKDIDRIAIGAGILGTGGGGSSYLGQLKAKAQLAAGMTIKVVLPEDLPDDATVLPLGGIGAPTVSIERIDEGHEGIRLIEAIEAVTGRRIDALVADEIGGANGIAPMLPAAQLGLPVVDADGMGRAFPETQMPSFFVGGQNTAPSALTDVHGNVLVVTDARSPEMLERMMRPAAIAMGCSALMSTAPMSGAFLKMHGIRHSISLAHRLGDAVLSARSAKTDPVDAICAEGRGVCLMRGKIVDAERRITNGFTRGMLTVSGLDEDRGRVVEIDLQNEFIVARENGREVATVPDLICVVDSEDGTPVSTEELKYGIRVATLCLPAPKLLRTESALAVMGPRAFGYDLDFTPFAQPYDPAPAESYAMNPASAGTNCPEEDTRNGTT